jgi:hypothetical protein
MANSISRQRPFPALFIILVLFLGCVYLDQVGQNHLGNWLPGIAGLARLDPSLIILDIAVRLPVTVDLILVPAFFILVYTLVILLYPSRQGMPRWRELRHRLGAVFSGLIIVLCCTAFGGLISWLLQDHLPRNVQNGLESLGMNADIGLPFSAYKLIHLHGNFIALICMTIGLFIAIGKINRAPAITKPTRLTREQRMTPYQRMLRDRESSRLAGPEKTAPAKTVSAKPAPPKPDPSKSAASKSAPSKPAQPKPTLPRAATRPIAATPTCALCYPEPLPTLQPEAVNYRPLW